MPVIIVNAPALASAEEERVALACIAAGVADALNLRPDDIYLTLCRSGTSVVGAEPVTPWPVVLLHGRARPADAMAAALRAVREAAAASWNCPADEVWAQWLVVADPAS